MRVLIAGAGVIGTVYGAHLGAAGHVVNVLAHPPRDRRDRWPTSEGRWMRALNGSTEIMNAMGGFTRMLLGSTAGQVVQHAHCPVVIVPPENRD
jgi:2-polyprenyl-6-methoxyphenol hydroxylase-like FAD-dependent oxidoreductase